MDHGAHAGRDGSPRGSSRSDAREDRRPSRGLGGRFHARNPRWRRAKDPGPIGRSGRSIDRTAGGVAPVKYRGSRCWAGIWRTTLGAVRREVPSDIEERITGCLSCEVAADQCEYEGPKSFSVLSPSSTKSTPRPKGAMARPNRSPPAPAGSTWGAATWLPKGVISTRFPFPPLAARMSPLGAKVSPSGPLRSLPEREERVIPPPVAGVPTAHGKGDHRDSTVHGIGHIELSTIAERQTCRSDYQGIRVGTFGESAGDHRGAHQCGQPGILQSDIQSDHRSLIHRRRAVSYGSIQHVGHEDFGPAESADCCEVPGPLILPPDQVSTGVPALLRTIRQPDCAVAEVPSLVGRLPTTTQPPGRVIRAVVRPTPPRACAR